MSEIFTKDQVSDMKAREARSIPIFTVSFDPETWTYLFLGYSGLQTLLESGAEVEKYVVAKLTEARKHLVPVQ